MAANSIAQQEITATEPNVSLVEYCEKEIYYCKRNILLQIALRHINTGDNVYQSKELSKRRKASPWAIKLSYYSLTIGRIDFENKR